MINRKKLNQNKLVIDTAEQFHMTKLCIRCSQLKCRNGEELQCQNCLQLYFCLQNVQDNWVLISTCFFPSEENICATMPKLNITDIQSKSVSRQWSFHSRKQNEFLKSLEIDSRGKENEVWKCSFTKSSANAVRTRVTCRVHWQFQAKEPLSSCNTAGWKAKERPSQGLRPELEQGWIQYCTLSLSPFCANRHQVKFSQQAVGRTAI